MTDLTAIAATLAERLAVAVEPPQVAERSNDRAERAAHLARALRDVHETMALTGVRVPEKLDDETQQALASLLERGGVAVGPGHALQEVFAAVEEVLAATATSARQSDESLQHALDFVASLRRGWLSAGGVTAERFVARADRLFAAVGADPEHFGRGEHA